MIVLIGYIEILVIMVRMIITVLKSEELEDDRIIKDNFYGLTETCPLVISQKKDL